MIGETLSHYRVSERLGGGGMGVVYRALDTKLDRHVALKLLPPDLTRDKATRERFVQEARAASALDHPNICTIHEIDTTPDGQMFIAMALYDGGTLKQRIEADPLPPDQALDIAMQIAEGLAEAHEAGIVHRDIKPANLMLTKRGLVKIVDFGVAKLLGLTGLTQTGSTLGTLSYMSPEQLDGAEVDQQSDVWSLGVVLYEMLTGAPPFRAESQWAVMNAIGNQDPERPSALASGVPPELDALVMRSLEKTKEKRFSSAREVLDAASDCMRVLRPAGEAGPGVPWFRRPGVLAACVATLVLVTSVVGWAWRTVSVARWAREEALPEMQRLIDLEGDYGRAYALAEEVEGIIPGDPLLADLWTAVSAPVSIETVPSSADVYFREFATGEAEAEWTHVGQTPLVDLRLPRGILEWRVEKAGYAPLFMVDRNPGDVLGNFPGVENPLAPARRIALLPEEALPEDMLFVPAGSELVPLQSFGFDLVPIESFLIDEHEVSNEEYQKFVDDGGYEGREFWDGLEFVKEGRVLSWEEAMSELKDGTGFPGPATWELGEYPDGQARFPVTGVNWYEAVAYAAYRGKSLPTLYHWARATQTSGAQPTMIPASNIGSSAPAQVGAHPGLGAFGAYDMVGNVREWVWNESGRERWSVGGGWSDQPYMATLVNSLPPFNRDPLNGFRLVQYLDDVEPRDALSAPVQITRSDHSENEPVSDPEYAAFSGQFGYNHGPLRDSVEWIDDTNRAYTRERVSIDAGSDGERFTIHLFLPKNREQPYPVVLFFPGLYAFQDAGHSDQDMLAFEGPEEFVWKSGMALAAPVFYRSYERGGPDLSLTGAELVRDRIDQLAHWRADAGRTLDYLATRDEVDLDRLMYMGFSYGASRGLPVLALEDRFKAAILVSGGILGVPGAPVTYTLNYLPRITVPVLMLSGRFDTVFPLEGHQQPLYKWLGAEDKEYKLYDAVHWPLPRNQWIPDALEWTERHLGSRN